MVIFKRRCWCTGSSFPRSSTLMQMNQNPASTTAFQAGVGPHRCQYEANFQSLADVCNVYCSIFFVNNYVWNVFLTLSNQKKAKKRHQVRHLVLVPHCRGRWWFLLRFCGCGWEDIAALWWFMRAGSAVIHVFRSSGLFFELEDYTSETFSN